MSELCPLTPRTLRRYEVTLLAAMYWPQDEIDNAVNVAQLESNWNTGARNTNGEDSRGLWQINVQAHAHLMDVNLFDPQINAYFAHQIWMDARSWRPWLNAARKLGLKI